MPKRSIVALPLGAAFEAGARAVLDRYDRLDQEAQAVVAATSHAPADIRPICPARV